MSGPSGVGKGTVVRRLLEIVPDLALSVSCTTREPRAGERDGVDYRFVAADTFRRLIDDGAFLEWAEVFGHRYGTLWAPIAEQLERGRDAVLEIDVQGARTVKEKVPDAVLVFLVPPSQEELERRLRQRRTEDETGLRRRLDAAQLELEEAGRFDRVVMNDEVDRAAAEVAAIIAGS